MDDLKNRSHVFLQNEDNLRKYLPNFIDKPAKHIIKYVHFEPFKYNVIDLKKDIFADLKQDENVVLFAYEIKKVFEKSKTYRVEI